MATEPLLSVRGEATLEVQPEIARLVISIAARDAKRERTLELLARRNDECQALLRRYGDAVERVETGGLVVYPELRSFGRGESVRAYAGSVRLDVTVVDFAVLGDLVARAADGDMTAIEGPWWRLRHDSPVHRQVRQQAARDAVARAREYAEAVGSRLTGLVELADEGLATGSEPRPPGGRPMAAFAARGRTDELAPIAMEPEVQVVRARIEARFTISPPEGL